jgi:hypothetical protein
LDAAWTIATIPVRIAAGNSAQAFIKAGRSASLGCPILVSRRFASDFAPPAFDLRVFPGDFEDGSNPVGVIS